MGILANSASVTHSSSSATDTKAGYVTNEQVTLSTSPLQAAYAWGISKPSGATSRSNLSDAVSATPVFTPDVAGTYVIIEGTSGFILTLTVTAVSVVSVANAHRFSPVTDTSVPAPALGKTLYVSSSQSNNLVYKEPDGNIVSVTGIAGGGWKPQVKAATTAALPAHTRTGNVLTASANGALASQDGVALVVGDLLLVKNEGSGTHLENGIYVVTSLGSASTPWVLTRAAWFNSSTGVKKGAFLQVSSGTVNGQHWFVLSTADPITVNTTALTFREVFGYGRPGTGGVDATLVGLKNVTKYLSMPPMADSEADFGILVQGGVFEGVYNQTAVIAHNPTGGGEHAGKPQFGIAFENKYKPSAGAAAQAEWYGFWDRDGSSQIRPISFIGKYDTGLVTIGLSGEVAFLDDNIASPTQVARITRTGQIVSMGGANKAFLAEGANRDVLLAQRADLAYGFVVQTQNDDELLLGGGNSWARVNCQSPWHFLGEVFADGGLDLPAGMWISSGSHNIISSDGTNTIVGSTGNVTIQGQSGQYFLSGGAYIMNTNAQSISVGNGLNPAHGSALLDLTSVTRGLLVPRMTTTQRDAISSPASGLVIYNTTTGKLNVRGASAWEQVTSA